MPTTVKVGRPNIASQVVFTNSLSDFPRANAVSAIATVSRGSVRVTKESEF